MTPSPNTLRIPFRPEELARLRAFAEDDCGESLEEYARAILLATLPTPALEQIEVAPRSIKAKVAVSPSLAAALPSNLRSGLEISRQAPKPNGAEAGGLVVLDEEQKPTRCDGCGQEVLRAKSRKFERTYSALLTQVDWSTKPPSARRHMCMGGGR